MYRIAIGYLTILDFLRFLVAFLGFPVLFKALASYQPGTLLLAALRQPGTLLLAARDVHCLHYCNDML